MFSHRPTINVYARVVCGTIAAVVLLTTTVSSARPWAWLGVRIRDLSEQEMDDLTVRHGLREGFGVVENMSGFTCAHCGERTAIFGDAGGTRIAEEYGVPLLAQIPLEPETRVAGDEGIPITLRRPDGTQAHAFADLARAVERRLAELGPLSSLPTVR